MLLMLAQQRKLLFQKGACADVLQADGVQHSGRSLKQTRRRIAGHGLARKALGHEAAQPAQA